MFFSHISGALLGGTMEQVARSKNWRVTLVRPYRNGSGVFIKLAFVWVIASVTATSPIGIR
jgi:hypothetical protein